MTTMILSVKVTLIGWSGFIYFLGLNFLICKMGITEITLPTLPQASGKSETEITWLQQCSVSARSPSFPLCYVRVTRVVTSYLPCLS